MASEFLNRKGLYKMQCYVILHGGSGPCVCKFWTLKPVRNRGFILFITTSLVKRQRKFMMKDLETT